MKIDLDKLISHTRWINQATQARRRRSAVQQQASAPSNAMAMAQAYVDRELDASRGHFGRFVVQALRDGLPIRICGTELPSSDRQRDNDWRPYLAYLDIAAAYFGYFGSKLAQPYQRIPAFPDRNRSWVSTLPKTTPRDVATALARAMQTPGRTVDQRRVKRQVAPFSVSGSRSVAPEDRRLTVLSMGGGRDSIALALILANYDDPWIVRHFPKAAKEARRYRSSNPDLDLVAAFSDTGDEYPFTYEVLDDFDAYLKKTGNGKDGARHPFQLVRLEKPVDPRTGKLVPARAIMQAVRGEELTPSSRVSDEVLRNQWWSHAIPGESAVEAASRGKHHLRPPLYLEHVYSGTMTARDNASCTANQKIVVLDRFVQDLASERFGIVRPWRDKGQRTTMAPWARAVNEARAGRHRRLIGIHAGERGRTDLRTGGRWPARIVDAHDSRYKPGAGPKPACTWGRRSGDFTPRPGYAGACYADATNEYHYPLVDWGIDEAGEEKILDHYGWGHTRKSGCRAVLRGVRGLHRGVRQRGGRGAGQPPPSLGAAPPGPHGDCPAPTGQRSRAPACAGSSRHPHRPVDQDPVLRRSPRRRSDGVRTPDRPGSGCAGPSLHPASQAASV
jgi:hypothetical protein